MRSFFDTSALLPCFFENHVHHEASLRAFLGVERGQGFCGAHSLAELYANATAFPGRNRLGGDQALLLLGEVRERLSVVALTSDEYYDALKDASTAGITGGTVYDLLLCQCALKAQAELIYTWNVRHFQQFSEDIRKRLMTP